MRAQMKRKKIWIALGIFAAVECLAFPEILFPDCIRMVKEERMEDSEKETATYQCKFWILEK